VLGWKDKTEQEITGADGAPLLTAINVSFIEADENKSD
jgi:hypothetical protein